MSDFLKLAGAVLGIVTLLGAFIATMMALSAGTRVFDVFVDRRVVESSRQYAETNTSGFYVRLEAIRKIDVQLAGLPPGDPQAAALASQRDLLVSEARRDVAKIPADARTSDMAPYGGF